MADPVEDEDEVDGCDLDFHEGESTTDEDLPAAAGAVALEGSGDEVDGCGLEFDDSDAVTDEDLPPAEGGVA
ncbi:MAG: hypothetical protein Kilf2KO_13150 [Rhodospirillales bacterium]